jgi:hypothetical protein
MLYDSIRSKSIVFHLRQKMPENYQSKPQHGEKSFPFVQYIVAKLEPFSASPV